MNIDLIVQTSYLFLFCLLLAAFEVQIEGKYGWAEKLPTWRPDRSKWYYKAYSIIMSDKELTGYHLLVFSFVLIFLHYPYFAGQAWNFSAELKTISFFFLISITWDFLWFVLNPYYGIKRFKSEHIWWHKKWFLFMPKSYYFAIIISALLYSGFSLNLVLFKEWLLIIGLFLVLILAVVIFSVVFRKNKSA